MLQENPVERLNGARYGKRPKSDADPLDVCPAHAERAAAALARPCGGKHSARHPKICEGSTSQANRALETNVLHKKRNHRLPSETLAAHWSVGLDAWRPV